MVAHNNVHVHNRHNSGGGGNTGDIEDDNHDDICDNMSDNSRDLANHGCNTCQHKR